MQVGNQLIVMFSIIQNEKIFCASLGGEAGSDMCTGDGGSPLACKNPVARASKAETYYLAGIVTGGVPGKCGSLNIPGIYEDVTKHVAWISEIKKELKLVEDY